MGDEIKEHIQTVKQNVEAACRRAGRNPDEVTLIAVSKTKPLKMLLEAYEAGARDFGENKVQEILEKAPKMPPDARFHMIGHLQRNKVRQVIPHVRMIHSVDSVRLAEMIQQEALRIGKTVDILLEVNVAKEESKFGMFPEQVMENLDQIRLFPNIRICGLMTIAPFVENSEENRPIFQKLYQLYVDIKKKNIDNVTMNVLSMGMTGDYQVAVEEGATMIRVGTGIFGVR
ncbi:MAG: YggS family pyridoxal phosphate-dependent enzyme [Eubacteriales bacterium]|nr:YggS family pyridoxal phosphate-dependent enzyme [Eubacteriales bacterium]